MRRTPRTGTLAAWRRAAALLAVLAPAHGGPAPAATLRGAGRSLSGKPRHGRQVSTSE